MVETTNKMGKLDMLNMLSQRVAKCKQCKDLLDGRIQTVFGRGSPEAKVVFVGEAPGRDENREGSPFVGRAGKLLDNILEGGGLDPEKDVYIMNVLKCWPPGNRNPEEDEVANCKPFFELQLEVLNPKIVVCLGRYAAEAFLGPVSSVSLLRKKAYPMREFKTWNMDFDVLVWYHPAYLLRSPAKKKDAFDDLKFLIDLGREKKLWRLEM